MKKRFILFDFDGVIADSFRPAFEIQKMICPHLIEDIYRKRFEGNINDWEEPINVHTEKCRHDIDFFTEYIPRMKNEAQMITSPIQEFLERHDLANHFAQIMGNDVHKSKVEKMKMVFEKYGVEAESCVFITDTLGDIHEAEKMGVGAVGITWGEFRRARAFRRSEAEAVSFAQKMFEQSYIIPPERSSMSAFDFSRV